MKRKLMIFAVSAMLASSQVYAQIGDAEAGREKSATCAACHGQTGISISPSFPHLAGQVPGYITTQLKQFQKGSDGGWNSSVMTGLVAGLSEKDMLDIDAFYSSQAPAVGSITPEQVDLALTAESIYRAGQTEYSISACMACHGPAGKGIAPHFPRLAGQSADYIRTQLLAYKSGERVNSIMNDIAFPLSESQIEALAAYVAGLD